MHSIHRLLLPLVFVAACGGSDDEADSSSSGSGGSKECNYTSLEAMAEFGDNCIRSASASACNELASACEAVTAHAGGCVCCILEEVGADCMFE